MPFNICEMSCGRLYFPKWPQYFQSCMLIPELCDFSIKICRLCCFSLYLEGAFQLLWLIECSGVDSVWLPSLGQKGNTASTWLSHLSGHHCWSHEQPWKNASLCKNWARVTRWRDYIEIEEDSQEAPAVPAPHCLASPAQGPDMWVEKPSSWHQLPRSLSATAGGNPSENHPDESSQTPELWEIIINDYFCFMPLNFGWFNAVISNRDKLAQAWASLCSVEFKRLSKISVDAWRNRQDCSLWIVSSYALTLTWSPAPISIPITKITHIKHLSE